MSIKSNVAFHRKSVNGLSAENHLIQRVTREIKVNSLDRAIELKKRGYIVTPDPEDPAHQASFKAGPLKQFERHSRLGFVDQEGFIKEVERIRAWWGKTPKSGFETKTADCPPTCRNSGSPRRRYS
ncbi:MAG: hypothetical protein JRJ04_08940 [Deltaproteobacteria bacterium]|nr:hypothetical protein [Deltaproteobacteria bacterium]